MHAMYASVCIHVLICVLGVQKKMNFVDNQVLLPEKAA